MQTYRVQLFLRGENLTDQEIHEIIHSAFQGSDAEISIGEIDVDPNDCTCSPIRGTDYTGNCPVHNVVV